MLGKKKVRKNRYKVPAKARSSNKKGVFRCLVWIVVGLSLLGLIGGGFVFSYAWITQTDCFLVEEVTVSGCERLSREEVLKTGGVFVGMNIFDLNLSRSRRCILSHPWVQKAEVIRVMPDQVRVRVTEHKPLAVVKLESLYLMNRSGAIFKKKEEEPDMLPVISGLLPEDLIVPGRTGKKSRQREAVMEVFSLKKETIKRAMGNDFERIVVDRDTGITLMSEGKIRCIHMGYGDYVHKMNRLEKVMKYVMKNDSQMVIEMVNLMNPGRISIRPGNNREVERRSQEGRGGRNAST